ncbi:MAG: hypothetical protein F4209_10840 [Chloroflexi bacterium]|nr:hypothetical protein [Chloroflexota bacterium]
MPDHFSTFTQAEALEALAPYTRELRKLMLGAEEDRLAQAESELYFECANGREMMPVKQEHAELVELVHNLDDEERQFRVALIKILAKAVKQNQPDRRQLLHGIRRTFDGHFTPDAGLSPGVENSVRDFFSDLQREIEPLGGGAPDW